MIKFIVLSLFPNLFEEFKNYKVKDIRPYLPEIKHFIKNGHLCSSICATECFYCYKCAQKIKKHLNIK